MSYGDYINIEERDLLFNQLESKHLRGNPRISWPYLLKDNDQLAAYYSNADLIGFSPAVTANSVTRLQGKVDTGSQWQMLPINGDQQMGLLSSTIGAIVRNVSKHPMFCDLSASLLLNLNEEDCQVLNGASTANSSSLVLNTPIVEMISGSLAVDRSTMCPPNCGSSNPSLPWSYC